MRNGAAFRCIEAIGQAIAYGMNTKSQGDPLIGLCVSLSHLNHILFTFPRDWLADLSSCVTFALLGAAILPMIMLVNTTPDRIPADIIAEEQNNTANKADDT